MLKKTFPSLIVATAVALAIPNASFAQSKRGYAPVHGLRMYYESRGSGAPLVLLHGGGSTIETTFGKVLPALAKHRRIIAVEQQGHGHTGDINRAFSFEQMADDTAELLRQLKVGRADFFGFSNGGNVAMQIAIRHPKLTHKIIVASAFYRNDGLYPAIRASFNQPHTPTDMPPPLRTAYLKVAPNPKALPAQTNKLMKMLSGFKDWPDKDLRSIKSPTLLIIGDKDIVRPEHAVQMFRLIPNSQLVIFPDSAHGAFIGEITTKANGIKPQLAVSMIERFLDAPMPKPAK